MAHLISNDDSRLGKVSDFEIQTISETGEIIKSDWYIETTFNKVFEMLGESHNKDLEISIFDNEGELQSIVTPKAESVKDYYVVMAY